MTRSWTGLVMRLRCAVAYLIEATYLYDGPASALALCGGAAGISPDTSQGVSGYLHFLRDSLSNLTDRAFGYALRPCLAYATVALNQSHNGFGDRERCSFTSNIHLHLTASTHLTNRLTWSSVRCGGGGETLTRLWRG